jgi:hypothetical protein
MALALDPSDDPPVNASLPAGQIGNSMCSYITDATGAWLYEEFAMMGDPQTVAQAYQIPGNSAGKGFGLASGGLPPESMLYGESFNYILEQWLGLQNWCPACPLNFQGIDLPVWQQGSQWMEGENNGDPTTLMSSGAGYVYAASDLTNLYNRPEPWIPADAILDISQATRNIFWLNTDYIVVYDRATSLNSGLFKKWNLSLVAPPVVNGSVVSDTLPSGQQLFSQTLLPKNPQIASFNGAVGLSPISDLEPTRYILQVQGPSLPEDTRFLHVLQGADAGAAMAPAAYLQSAGGAAFDGAAFGTTVVYFPVNANPSPAATTLPAPAGTHTAYIAGLVPGTGYHATVNGGVIALSPNGAAMTDSAGVLRPTY